MEIKSLHWNPCCWRTKKCSLTAAKMSLWHLSKRQPERGASLMNHRAKSSFLEGIIPSAFTNNTPRPQTDGCGVMVLEWRLLGYKAEIYVSLLTSVLPSFPKAEPACWVPQLTGPHSRRLNTGWASTILRGILGNYDRLDLWLWPKHCVSLYFPCLAL